MVKNILIKARIGLGYVCQQEFFYKHAANFITAIGFCLAGYVNFLLWLRPENNRFLIFWLNLIVGVTDKVDGWLAKKLKIASSLGSDLDKARDKFYICLIFLWLLQNIWQKVWQENSPGIIFVLFVLCLNLSVEALLIIMWVRCKRKKIDSSARQSGKIKMALYYMAVDWWFLGWMLEQKINPMIRDTVFGGLMFVAWIFAYYSLMTYYQRYSVALKK